MCQFDLNTLIFFYKNSLLYLKTDLDGRLLVSTPRPLISLSLSLSAFILVNRECVAEFAKILNLKTLFCRRLLAPFFFLLEGVVKA